MTTPRKERLGSAPPADAGIEECAAFIGRGYGVRDGDRVARVVRHGGRDGTGITVFIACADGEALRINYAREADCCNPNRLRATAARDTNGRTRGDLINSPAAAHAIYEAMCCMADHFAVADLDGQTWEWVQELERVAQQTGGKIDDYQTLRNLQAHDYSKNGVQNPDRTPDGMVIKQLPLLLVENDTDCLYVTARHMAVFLRYDLGVEDAGSDDQILTRLKRIGGDRIYAEEWDRTGRDRQHKVRLVLYRLPVDGGDR